VEVRSTFHFLNGQCHTVLPLIMTKEAGSLAGYSITLRHHTSQAQQRPWNVYVHQVSDMWTGDKTYYPYVFIYSLFVFRTENTLQNAGSQELIVLPVGQEANVKVSVHQLERVNHPNSPCNTDRLYSATNVRNFK